MNLKHILFVLPILLISCQSKSQDRVSINVPSAQSEAEYIWRTLQDIVFFEKNNYDVSLPKGSLIDELKQKSKLGSLTDVDYNSLKTFITDSIYNEADYKSGLDKIEDQLPLIHRMINQISESSFNWDFREFEIYQINLTLYGPGGSYDPDAGSILIFTTPDGRFKNYENPANTIIHEIVHIGIEESIIVKHNVPHSLKERIVDTFVSLSFGEYLPNYRVQDMGENRTDTHLKTLADLNDLDEIVGAILK